MAGRVTLPALSALVVLWASVAAAAPRSLCGNTTTLCQHGCCPPRHADTPSTQDTDTQNTDIQDTDTQGTDIQHTDTLHCCPDPRDKAPLEAVLGVSLACVVVVVVTTAVIFVVCCREDELTLARSNTAATDLTADSIELSRMIRF